MRIACTLLVLLTLAVACNKEKPEPAKVPVDDSTTIEDSTDTKDTTIIPVYKDSTLRIVGIDSNGYLLVPQHGYIEVPITIMRDTGIALDVTLSLAGFPLRAEASLEQDKGTTPFTTKIKISTYMIPEIFARNDTFCRITAVASNGDKIEQKVKLTPHLAAKPSTEERIYNLYQKSPEIYTYRFTGGGYVPVWDSIKMHYDAVLDKFYFTNFYLGEENGKVYISKNNKYAPIHGINGDQFIFNDMRITGHSSTDSKIFDIDDGVFDCYHYLPASDHYNYTLTYVSNGERYVVVGKLIF